MSRRMEIAVLSVAVALCLAGCKKSGQEPTDANQTAAGQITEQAGQAVQATADLVAQQKDKLLKASQEQLAKLEQQVEAWLAEAGLQDEQAKQKLDALSAKFQGALGEARGALEKAKGVGAEVWQEARPSIEAAVTKARNAHDELMAYLKALARKQTEEANGGPTVVE
jgi:hypothetical protein